MATLTIKNVPEATRRALKARAAAHNRSMEAEVRATLEDAVATHADFIMGWLAAAERERGTFDLPARRAPRSVALS